MRLHPGRVARRAQAQLRRQPERQAQADRHRLPVQQRPAIADLRLQRVAEGVAEVQQGAAARRPLLPLIVAHDLGLEGAGAQDGLRLDVPVAVGQRRAVLLAPFEEHRVADQPGLHHLRIAGPQLAPVQRAERAGVGQHQARLVEGADQVLALRRVDPGLAAHAAVHLGQQRRRHLDEGQAAQRGRGGETREVANHPAAQRDHRGPPLDACVQQPVHHAAIARHALGRLARRHDDLLRRDPGLRQAVQQRRQMQGRHVLVRHHNGAALRHHRRQQRPGPGQQAVADHHLVRRGGKPNRQPPRLAPFVERLQDLGHGVLQRFIAAIDGDVGLGVDRMALLHQSAKDLRRVAGVQKRAVAAGGDPAQQGGQPAAQPHRDGAVPNRAPGLGVYERAAAGGEDQWTAVQQPADHPALPVTEVALPITVEQLGDAAPGGQLDFRVGVAERQAKAGGHAAADAGLARAHQADQHDAPPGEPGRKAPDGRRSAGGPGAGGVQPGPAERDVARHNGGG